MTAKNKRGTGRVTPKGTKDPNQSTKAKRHGLAADAAGPPPHELAGKAGKQSGRRARPVTHNRGNR
jgi:hypothetical protein